MTIVLFSPGKQHMPFGTRVQGGDRTKGRVLYKQLTVVGQPGTQLRVSINTQTGSGSREGSLRHFLILKNATQSLKKTKSIMLFL